MSVPEHPLEAAARRLEQALNRLEQRLASVDPHGAASDLFADDRAQLAAELDAARARNRELEAVAAEASTTLGRAASEIRAVVSDPANEDA